MVICSACLTTLDLAVAKGFTVCPYICMSVTLVSHAEMVEDIKVHFIPYHRVVFLVS